MSDTILGLMEEQVRILTIAVAELTAHVTNKQAVFEAAALHRRSIELAALTKATLDLAALTGRLREAERALKLIQGHEGDVIT